MSKHKHGDIIDAGCDGGPVIYLFDDYYWLKDSGTGDLRSSGGYEWHKDKPVIGNIFSVLRQWKDSQK